MSVVLTEAFARNPDWSNIPAADQRRGRELVIQIQAQINRPRTEKGEEYYGWLLELNRILH